MLEGSDATAALIPEGAGMPGGPGALFAGGRRWPITPGLAPGVVEAGGGSETPDSGVPVIGGGMPVGPKLPNVTWAGGCGSACGPVLGAKPVD